MKFQLTQNDGGVWGNDPDGIDDTVVLRSTEQTAGGNWNIKDPAIRKLTMSEKVSTLLEEGDILITKSSGSSAHIGKSTLVSAEIAETECCYSNFMQRIRLCDGLSPKLVWYILNSDIGRVRFDFVSNSTTGLANLNANLIGNLSIALGTKSEQENIVAFLNTEIDKIDNLISEQKKIAQILKEKRDAIITKAVTNGLSHNSIMKAVQAKWLRAVPVGWNVRKLTDIAKLETGHTPSRLHPEYWILEECCIPWFTLADVGVLRDGQVTEIAETSEQVSQIGIDNSAARLLPEGTVILSRTASVGFSGIMSVPMAVSQDFAAWICGRDLRPEYLLFCLRAMKQEFKRLMFGSTHKTIYMPDIKAMRIPLPPLPEQDAIIAHIKRTTADIDAVHHEAIALTRLLRERRAALISAAVTGKIDVRGYSGSGLTTQAAA